MYSRAGSDRLCGSPASTTEDRRRGSRRAGRWHRHGFLTAAIGTVAIGVLLLSAPVSAQEPPGAPATPTVESGDGELTVTWEEPDPADTSIVHYIVEYAAGEDSWKAWQPADGPITATTTTIGGLRNGVTYRVRVIVVTEEGAGEPSEAALATPRTAVAAQTVVSWNQPRPPQEPATAPGSGEGSNGTPPGDGPSGTPPDGGPSGDSSGDGPSGTPPDGGPSGDSPGDAPSGDSGPKTPGRLTIVADDDPPSADSVPGPAPKDKPVGAAGSGGSTLKVPLREVSREPSAHQPDAQQRSDRTGDPGLGQTSGNCEEGETVAVHR
jgi:hypothetical protein